MDENEHGEGNAFDWRESNETEKIDLPTLFVTEPQHKGHRKIAFFIILALVTVLICIFIFAVPGKESETIEIPLPTDSAEEWRGAFSRKDIYDRALKSSVGLRKGSGEGKVRWSGVILTDSGWIATSSSALEGADRGRIYVELSDGREYEAESIYRRGEAAVLKISATGLFAVDIGNTGLHVGESVCAIENRRDLLTGTVTNTYGGVEIDISLGQSGEGAPVFDNSGGFVGLAMRGVERVKIFDISGIFEEVKENN